MPLTSVDASLQDGRSGGDESETLTGARLFVAGVHGHIFSFRAPATYLQRRVLRQRCTGRTRKTRLQTRLRKLLTVSQSWRRAAPRAHLLANASACNLPPESRVIAGSAAANPAREADVMTMSSLASRLTLCHTGSHVRQTVCSCTIRGKQKGAGKSSECVVKNSISLRITLLKINRLSASAAASGCSCKPRKRREPARSAFLRIAVPAREPAPRRSLDAHSRQDLQKPCETAEQGSANR